MKEPHIIHQTWPFTCLDCRHAWESAYEAWHADDGRGGQVITWRHKGTASTPPWIEPECPACSGLHVKSLPPGSKPPAGDYAGTRPPESRRPADTDRVPDGKRPESGGDRPARGGKRPAPLRGRRRSAKDPRPGVPPRRRRTP